MSQTTRNAILSAQPNEIDFTLKIGDKTFKLKARQLTGEQSDAVSKYAIDENGKMNPGAFYNCRIVHSVIEAKTGERLFEDADVDSLNGMPSSILNTLREKVSLACNDLTNEEVQERKK